MPGDLNNSSCSSYIFYWTLGKERGYNNITIKLRWEYFVFVGKGNFDL